MKAKEIVSLIVALTAAAAIATCGRKGPEAPPDTTPPAIIATSPYYHEQNVPVNVGTITMTFSEEMDPSTVNNKTISLMTGTAAVAGSVACTGTNAVFTPDADLAPNSNYRLIIANVKDTAGNGLPAPLFFPFTTGTGARTFTVTPSVQGSGSISPGTPIQMKYNETAVFTAVPESGNYIESVTGCGGTLSGQTYTTGAIREDCAVVATFAADSGVSHTITAIAGPNGTISPSGTVTIGHGGVQQFTVSPLPGYSIDSVTGCAGELSENTYTTGAITADCTVSAGFAADAPATHTITVDVGAGGSMSPPGPTLELVHGASQSFTVTPDPGYHTVSVAGCSGTLSGTIYQTAPITSDCAVKAVFGADAPATYVITATAGSHGTISPSGPVTVTRNENLSFDINARLGYVITNVQVDGIDIGLPTWATDYTYTFFNVTSDHTITAGFDTYWHVITASADANGSISPSGVVTVSDGADQSFTITPNTGYTISMVLVDNVPDAVATRYTFSNVTADHSIHVSFVEEFLTVTPLEDPNGSISPNAAQQVPYNGTVTFTVAANTGYFISSVSGCGQSFTGDIDTTGPIAYTFGPVTADCTVSPVFSQRLSI